MEYVSIPYDFIKAVDADVASTALDGIHKKYGKLTPEFVIQEASKKRHPLHSCFTWNDTKAAHKWRVTQAKSLIRVIVRDIPSTNQKVRAYISVRNGNDYEYKPISIVLNSKSEREQMMNQLKADLNRIDYKYRAFKYLTDYCNQLQKLNRKIKL